ncbi:MAG: heat-shock protein HtpX, partial [Verrucomicrobiota bacterium]
MEPATTADSDTWYPAPPPSVPKDLAKATARYRFHAWLAMGGLFLFAVFYLSLTAWFGWSAYRLLESGFLGNGGFFDVLKGFGSGVVAVFLIKGLFFRKESGGSRDFQITQETQPRLFSFLREVAKEAGAPRP